MKGFVMTHVSAAESPPSATNQARQIGDGPLSRAAANVYTVLVVGLFLVLATLPGLVPLALLDRDVSNLPLVALCAVPFGPALSAAVYALHHRRNDITDLAPAAAFVRGYRANVRGALALWLPALAWLTVVAVTLANFTAAGVPGWWAVLLVVIAAVVTLWGVLALVVSSLFNFRTRDVARLAAFFLGAEPRVTIGVAALVFVAVGVTLLLSEVVLLLAAPLFVLALVRTCAPMAERIKVEFTA
jgi:hypothetical protein